jgi:hypothetical protein
MPLIEKEDRREEEPLRVRLNPGVAEQLKAYSKFIESSEGHIVNAALQRLFAADKDFKEFIENHPDAGRPEPVQPVAVKPPRRKKPEGEDTAAA